MSCEKIDGEFRLMYAWMAIAVRLHFLIAFLIENLKRQKIGISKFSAWHKSEIIWLIYNIYNILSNKLLSAFYF